MEIPVLIERIGDNGYRVRSGEPLACSAEVPTREEAKAKLREQIVNRLSSGTNLDSVEVPSNQNPWIEFAGMFKDDPYFDEWQAAIAENRRRIEEEPEIP